MTEPIPTRPDEPGPAERVSPETPPVDATGVGRPSNPVALLLAAGVMGGLVSWLGGEACRDLIQPPRHAVSTRGTLTLNVVRRRDAAIAEIENAALAFAILGMVLGASLGAAGGLARRSGTSARSAALVGAAMGLVGCAAMSAAVLPLYDVYRRRDPDAASRDLLFPLLVHASIWSAAGAAGGAAFGIGWGRRGVRTRAAMGGLLGAAAAAMAYEVIGVVAFPDAGTTQYVSWTWPTRLLARLAVGTMAAVGVAMATAPPREPSPQGPL